MWAWISVDAYNPRFWTSQKGFQAGPGARWTHCGCVQVVIQVPRLAVRLCEYHYSSRILLFNGIAHFKRFGKILTLFFSFFGRNVHVVPDCISAEEPRSPGARDLFFRRVFLQICWQLFAASWWNCCGHATKTAPCCAPSSLHVPDPLLCWPTSGHTSVT